MGLIEQSGVVVADGGAGGGGSGGDVSLVGNREIADAEPKPLTGKARRLANLTGGSRLGVPNKNTTLLKDAILMAATKAGGKAGLVGYLETLATNEPVAFCSLLGKVLPMQLTGDGGGPIRIQSIQLVGVREV